MIDKQWSQVNRCRLYRDLFVVFWLLKNGKKKNILFIEQFFHKIFKRNVTLTTSGRRAIYAILDTNKINREKTVFITKFSSFCLYQSVGSLSNVSTDNLNQNVVLVNHKWGKLNLVELDLKKSTLIIEDSCDSLIERSEDVLMNNGSYEIISLSKIIGSFSGGIIIHNTDAKKIYETQRFLKHSILSYIQIVRKILRSILPYRGFKPLGLEHLNQKLTSFEVAHIRTCLENYSRNIHLAKSRYDEVAKLFGSKFKKLSLRFGPGLVLQLEENNLSLLKNSLPQHALIRYFDISLSNDSYANHQQVLYLPVHSGISDTLFEEYLTFIHKNSSSIKIIF